MSLLDMQGMTIRNYIATQDGNRSLAPSSESVQNCNSNVSTLAVCGVGL